MKTLAVNVQAQQTIKAADLLADHCDLSKSKIKDAMAKGAVWLTQGSNTRRLRRASTTLGPGDQLSLYYNESILAGSPPAPELIAQSRQYSVWHKPAGMMSSGTRFGDHFAIDRYIQQALDRQTYLVHRLDRFTRGLMVIAETQKAAATLSEQFQQRTTEKRYLTVVEGEVPGPVTITAELDGKEAISHVTPIESAKGRSLLEVHIETGRKHQIRRHLLSIGLPVLGDRQYGNSQYPELQLVAYILGFDCPETGERIRFELPVAHQLTLAGLAQGDSA